MNLVWHAARSGRGVVVLLHGAMARAATWWRIGPALSVAGWHTEAVDLPGHGEAPPLSGAFSLESFAQQTAERMPPRTDLLIGHSLGAIVALTLAARPGFARAVVLEDPPGSEPDGFPAMAAGIRADADLAARDRRALLRRTRTTNPDWAEQDVQHAIDGIVEADADGFIEALATRPTWHLPSMVASVGLPVCVLAPPNGALVKERRALRGLVPGEHFVVLDGGHCLHRSRPDQWLESVRRFADAVLPPTTIR
ncbi:alpha/beta fold hydrolase [Micromonospora sp. CA-263727]|uniref:alpha/beta fold hydrolase n=1 Tax=Micromonospora sp. CA-263727 TaxID=3239967 RepID=UPI003D92DC38